MRARSLFITLAVLAALLVVPAAAQDATPTVDAADPALCTLNPLTPDDLQRIQDADLPPIETPTPVADPFVMPAGDELFTHDQEEVQKDLRRAIACVNTGEPLKALAAYTERWIANFLTEEGGLDDDLIAGLQVDRDLQPESYLRILDFGEAVRLPDDRIAILVTGDDPADADPPEERLFLMAEVRPGRFLIDEVIPISGS
ncbi:MAG TPA: hypothetical protein VFP05_07840 [Thermomicrobiales bacterium]|nr:hypothetical protein [Thermomicrobiales bacterium]